MVTKDIYGTVCTTDHGFFRSMLDLEVAKAAEETRPHEAIQFYQEQAERLIAQRGRNNYQAACTHLIKMRTLYERLGEQEKWEQYIAVLREQNRSLRALKEEMARAELL